MKTTLSREELQEMLLHNTKFALIDYENVRGELVLYNEKGEPLTGDWYVEINVNKVSRDDR